MTGHSARKWGLLSACAVLALLSPATSWAAPAVAPVEAATTQLPRGITPTHYAIRVVPDAAALTFAATAEISIEVAQPTDSITLNAAELSIKSAQLLAPGQTSGGQAPQPLSIRTDAKAQTVTLGLAAPLQPGSYRLSFTYDGVINTQANGLFALDYIDNDGQSKRALFTQFEAPDARRFVPSWDEPSYKATFDLSVLVPKGQMAVSNMPVVRSEPQADGRMLTSFATTPRMSTYLLFLGLGELERKAAMAGATEIGVVTGKGNSGRAQLALDAATEILPWYNDYFGVAYPLPKLDNVAGPGQSQFFAAMENWGAIFTFERSMLVDPASTSEATRRRVYEIVAHEMAHQWFGNLVTMAWWDDLWLNEGFASWMATKVTDRLKPEWQVALNRVGGREAAMSLDAFSTTHPVVQKIATVEEINQAFDAITYEKGEAVIAMLENYAGEDVWRKGIRAYMQRNAYGNTRTADLWRALEEAGAFGLGTIAQDFTTLPGIPLIKVKKAQCVAGNTLLSLQQSRFHLGGGSTQMLWHVPVRAQVLGQDVQQIILRGSGKMELPGCGPYLLNVEQAGYYRSLYPKADVAALAANLARLSPIDQLGAIADNWQLGQGKYQNLSHALNLLAAIPDDASDVVLAAVPNYLGEIHQAFRGDAGRQELVHAYARKRLGPVLDRIGYDPKPGEGAQVPILRQNIISTLGGMSDAAVLGEARRRFAAFSNDPKALDGQLKYVWLNIVAQHADAATWDVLRAMANKAPTALDRARSFTLLGRAADDKLATRALELALTDEPGKTTSAAIIDAVSDSFSLKALDFVLAHKAQYDALVDVSARNQALARLADTTSDLAVASKLEAYATVNITGEGRIVIMRAVTGIHSRAAGGHRLRKQLSGWLARQQ